MHRRNHDHDHDHDHNHDHDHDHDHDHPQDVGGDVAMFNTETCQQVAKCKGERGNQLFTLDFKRSVCLLFICYLSATCLLLVCYLSATCLLLVCYYLRQYLVGLPCALEADWLTHARSSSAPPTHTRARAVRALKFRTILSSPRHASHLAPPLAMARTLPPAVATRPFACTIRTLSSSRPPSARGQATRT